MTSTPSQGLVRSASESERLFFSISCPWKFRLSLRLDLLSLVQVLNIIRTDVGKGWWEGKASLKCTQIDTMILQELVRMGTQAFSPKPMWKKFQERVHIHSLHHTLDPLNKKAFPTSKHLKRPTS